MTTINIRIEEKTKKAASKVFKEAGIDLSAGVRFFLTRVAAEKEFHLISPKKAKALRAKWDKETAEALRSGKRYTSGAEVLADLLK